MTLINFVKKITWKYISQMIYMQNHDKYECRGNRKEGQAFYHEEAQKRIANIQDKFFEEFCPRGGNESPFRA